MDICSCECFGETRPTMAAWSLTPDPSSQAPTQPVVFAAQLGTDGFLRLGLLHIFVVANSGECIV